MAHTARDDEDAPSTARLFWNGRSQAVRLPKEFRFSGSEVRIRREGPAVILEPMPVRNWPPDHWEELARLRSELDMDSLQRPGDSPPEPVDLDPDEP